MAARSDGHGPPLVMFKPDRTLLFFLGVGDLGMERTAKMTAALEVQAAFDVALHTITAAASIKGRHQQLDDSLRNIFECRGTIGVRCVPARV